MAWPQSAMARSPAVPRCRTERRTRSHQMSSGSGTGHDPLQRGEIPIGQLGEVKAQAVELDGPPARTDMLDLVMLAIHVRPAGLEQELDHAHLAAERQLYRTRLEMQGHPGFDVSPRQRESLV
jgi:hypothetical protein